MAGEINLFAYVQNNPINFIDPDGLKFKGCGGDDDQIDVDEFLEQLYGIDADKIKREALIDSILLVLAPEAVVSRSPAQKAKFLKDLLKNGKVGRWMKQWLKKGKVPPGHHVDHIKPLSVGGKDAPTNMRLQGIDLHKNHHRFYHPWRK